MTLTQSDLIVVQGEPRVTCRRLAEVLGYTRLDNFHRLIRANEDELRDFGGIFLFQEEKSGRGRPGQIFQLNEKQAIAITMWANTPQARTVRRLIVEVFLAWRHGHIAPAAPRPDMHEISADRLIELLQSENQLLRQQIAKPKRKRKPATPISDAERQEILRQIRAGLSVAQISRLTGRSSAAISMMRSGLRVIEGGRHE